MFYVAFLQQKRLCVFYAKKCLQWVLRLSSIRNVEIFTQPLSGVNSMKKVLPLAIAAALVVPAAAMADATVFGKVHMIVQAVDDGRTTTTAVTPCGAPTASLPALA